MTPEEKLAWVKKRLREEQGRVDGSITSALLLHFERRLNWMRETNGPSSNGERAEIDSMAEAFGWPVTRSLPRWKQG